MRDRKEEELGHSHVRRTEHLGAWQTRRLIEEYAQ